MAKKAYIGVMGDAPVKKTYTGLGASLSELSQWFTITNSNYYFAEKKTTLNYRFVSNNKGVNSSVATTTLRAIYNDTLIGIGYGYSTEKDNDKFQVTTNGVQVISVSGDTNTGSWTGMLNAGEEIVFTYEKNSTVGQNDDECYFYVIALSATTGYEQRPIAKKVNKMYIGIGGVAKRIKKAYIGIGGVAEPCWSDED